MTQRRIGATAKSIDRGDLIEDPALTYKDGPHHVQRRISIGLIEDVGPTNTPGWVLIETGRDKPSLDDRYDPVKCTTRIVVREDRIMTLVLP